MNDKKTTSQFVDELIESVSGIETVDTPPFFKDRVLKQLGKTEETVEVPPFFHWFTPKLQLAALMVFVLINLGVLYYYNSFNQDQELQSFAEAYGLSESSEESILN